ncbi:MAG: M14 family zinc carboxypeptidase [Candidatus Zixiibacteriota bacterium]
MRNYYISCALLVILVSSLFTTSFEKPYKVDIVSKMQLRAIIQSGANIENTGKDWAKINADIDAKEELMSLGFELTELVDTSRINMLQTKRLLDWGSYHTYAELTSYLADIEYDYPSLATVFSIGESVEGRELWCIKISDNVSTDEFEPEICYISTIHGDEPVGTELLLALADSLTRNYGVCSDITRLVDSCEIYLIPLMNPDGYVAGNRQNANGVDLNRNFPVPDGGIGDDGTYTIQTENQRIIDFYDSRYINFTINFHTGALVVNYPWDYISDDSPDHELYIQRSLDYSTRNLPMYTGSFPQGITNGYDWYEVDGTMQDWTYHNFGDLHLTVELNNTKWPPASELDELWEDNYEAILFNISRSLMGVKGIVTDSITTEPLGALVTIIDNDKKVRCDPAVGDYHRQLLPGSYSLRFECDGYFSKDISIEVPDTGASIYHIMLAPYNTDTLYFCDFEDDDGSLRTISSIYYQDWQWGAPMSGPGDAYSGSNVWGTRLMYDYHDSSQSRLALDIDLSGIDNAILTFWQWHRFQDSNLYGWHDGGNVKWHSEGITQLLIPDGGYNGTISEYNLHIPDELAFVGDNGGWEKISVDLSDYIGESGQIFFDFGSSSINTEAGWFIDDLLVVTALPLEISSDNKPKPSSIGVKAYPNPFNSSVSIELDGQKNACIYDLNGKSIHQFDEAIGHINWQPERDLPSGAYILKVEQRESIILMYIK